MDTSSAIRPSRASARRITPRRTALRLLTIALAAFIVWIGASVAWPAKRDFRSFDGVAIGQLDAAMWRSYYERKPLLLFTQLTRALRVQFQLGHVRSYPAALHAVKAAFAFKDGHTRDEYAKALPELERYFAAINASASAPFDVRSAARDELEWWIIRRERDRHTTAEWEQLIAAVGANIYHVPAPQLAEYARLRVEAMVLRDERGEQIAEADWSRIGALLEQSWMSLATAAHNTQ